MRIARRTLEQFAPEAWDRLAGGRAFASASFAALWRAQGGEPVAWVAEAGGEPVAMVPGVEFGRGPLARFLSMPDGGYGGLCTGLARGAEREHAGRELLAAIARRRYLRCWIFDFYGSLDATVGYRRHEQVTTLVDISSPDWRPPDAKLLEQVRKAEREGIRVETMDWLRHGAGFLDLVATTAARHGVRPRHPARFYAELADLAVRDERVHWVVCDHDGTPACSHIYLLEAGRLQGWQIHFDKAFSFLKPNQYIRYAVCREMARQGVRELNLGGTPEGAPGLEHYKRRWGGDVFRYRSYLRRTWLGRLLVRPGRR